MTASRSARRQAITYVALLAVTLLLIAFSGSPVVTEIRRGVGFAMSPVQNVLREGAQTLGSFFATIGEIERLRVENEQLTRRLNELEALNRGLLSLRAQNEQLTELLNIRSSLDYETVAAEVTSRRSTGQERVISLDRGTEAGITVEDPVVAGGGALVGQVVEAGNQYSRVLLLTDPTFFVAGVIESSRALGDVRGQSERPLQMTGIPATDEVNVGESVVTAGIELTDGIRSPYPRGLLIGSIADVQRSPDQLFQTALVVPAAALDRLEYVLVITDYEGGLPDASPDASAPAGGEPTSSPAGDSPQPEPAAPSTTPATSPRPTG